MRILMSSHAFAPSVGGLESVSMLLAQELTARGHELRVITQTPASGSEPSPCPVYRRPSATTLMAQVRWCEVFFHNNISLRCAWPLLLVRRPWVVAHHVWIPNAGATARLKRLVLRYATGIAASSALAAHLSTPSAVIPNPYDDGVFREHPEVERSRDIIFVGRLVSDKGATVLLNALAELEVRGLRPSVTIVGSGPEQARLFAQVRTLGFEERVRFAGMLRGQPLVELLNAHRLLVIPSIWNEPFGVVALEAMACGCVPVGSAGGGLPEAIGPGGETFDSGSASALARSIARLLGDPARLQILRTRARAHLLRHARSDVADRYQEVFRRALCAPAARRSQVTNVRDA